MAVSGNEEHKQRINLSAFARSVIEIDRSVFDEGGSLSGFLNRIITAFRHSADASVELAVAERQQQLLADGHTAAEAEKLAQAHGQRLLAKLQSYPRGDSLSFRLNNRNFHILYTQRAEGSAYSAPSKYLKALLEEYTRLSPSEREAVYYDPLIRHTLQPALDAGQMLQVQLGEKRFLVRPHSLMADPFNSHLYLVGITRRTDVPAEEEVVASFRVSRLEQTKQLRLSGRLDADQRRQVEKQLQQVGVQYLVGSQEHIVVELTPAGRQAFGQRSYMRPLPTRQEGSVYHFHCAPLQVKNYFLSFGKDAQVLEPASLREEFARFYRDAEAAYL